MRVLRARDGFTVVELLVTMAIALIVFAATLDVLGVFSKDSQAMTRRDDAQNAARLATDQIVRQLRNIIASSPTSPKLLERALPYDMVFQTIGTPTATDSSGAERVRYCIPPGPASGSPADEVLIAQTQAWPGGADPGDPWTAADLPCPDPNYPSVVLAAGVTNRRQGADRTAFAYNGGAAPGDLTTIDTVGIDLFVNPTPGQADAETELRSGVFLRNQQRPPVAGFTYAPVSGHTVLLNAGTSYDPSGQNLSYSWTCTGAAPCSSPAAIFSWDAGQAGTFAVTLTVTDQSGLQSSKQIEVSVP